jgi:hypothetical protein
MSLSEQPPSDHPTARAFSAGVGSPKSGGLGWWWHTVEDTMDKLDPDLLLRDAQIYMVAIGRLAGDPLLPLSAVAEADELVRRLVELDRIARHRFDLSTTIGTAKEAHAVAEDLETWRGRQTHSVSAAKAGLFNRGINGLLRGLVGALNSEHGPYAQDPAAAVPPLPLLDPVRALAALEPESDEARFMTVDLVRARNRLEDLVRQGTIAGRQAMEGLR